MMDEVAIREPKRSPRTAIHIGDTFGSWRVLSAPLMIRKRSAKYRVHYECVCICGNTSLVIARNLTKSVSTRCVRCNVSDVSARNETHGASQTVLYQRWKAMRRRCDQKNAPAYRFYGGRGIKVCDAWQTFPPFQEWALDSGFDETLTLDRINVDGDYEPGNCRWVTQDVQTRNQRSNRIVVAFNESKCIEEWARDSRSSVSGHQIAWRLNRGWPPELAITLDTYSHALPGLQRDAVKELERLLAH